MNSWLFASGIVAALTTIGHFAGGRKMFVRKMLEAEFDEVAKKMLFSVFHFMSVLLIATTAVLLMAAFQADLGGSPGPLIRFIAINYFGFALWQLEIALVSRIPKAPLKLFLWIFFLLIAITAWIGGGAL